MRFSHLGYFSISLLSILVGLNSSFASARLINSNLSALLSKHYAYKKSNAPQVSTLISELESGPELVDREGVENFLLKFGDRSLHLATPRGSIQNQKNETCVTHKRDHLKINSFRCELSAGESEDNIKRRFANKFVYSLESVFNYIAQDNGSTLYIDLRGNLASGNEEMELALYPFISDGSHIYDYQFKFFDSPHFIAQATSKVLKAIHIDSFFGFLWDFRRKAIYKFKTYLWEKEVREELLALRRTFDEEEYYIEVLVDDNTSGSSEIFASILMEYKNAELRGERTRGESSFSERFELLKEPYLELSIPTSRIWRTNGESIIAKGLAPQS